MKKQLKKHFYNNPLYYFVALGLAIIILIINFITEINPIISTIVNYLFCVAALMFLINIVWNEMLNKNNITLKCSRSFFVRNHIWINQRTIIKRKKIRQCPIRVFVRELQLLSNDIPKGTVCYCCTHELIVNHIKKIFEVKVCEEYGTKSLKRLKKLLKCNICKTCKSSDCTLFKENKTKFYNVKFIR